MKTFLLTRRSARRALRGFSLAELMVVIVILGLLATLVANNVIPILFKANRTVVMSDINAICQAIDSYRINNGGRAPDSLEELVMPDENNNTYLNQRSLPLDPWKNPYDYQAPMGGQEYQVISYGKDGQPGGEGDDADISNLTMREKK